MFKLDAAARQEDARRVAPERGLDSLNGNGHWLLSPQRKSLTLL
jgi:hypothetical protein